MAQVSDSVSAADIRQAHFLVAELAVNMAAAQVTSAQHVKVKQEPIIKPEPGRPSRNRTVRGNRNTKTSKQSQATTGKVQRFVQKLSSLVGTDHFGQNLVGWGNTGASFVVHQPVQFAKEILPLYFNTTNMSSFTRQLHFYGFKKIVGSKRNADVWEFEHQWFHREHPEWLTRISRKRCNVQNVSPEELSEMKQKISSLESTVSQQQEQMKQMYSMLMALMAEKKRHPSPSSTMHVESGHERKRRAVEVLSEHPDATVVQRSVHHNKPFSLRMEGMGFEAGFGLALEDDCNSLSEDDRNSLSEDDLSPYWM